MSTLARGRAATALLFASYGVILGTWTARIPAIKHGLGLGDGQLSIGLLGFAAGAITGMQLTGRLADRYGAGRIVVPALAVDAALFVSPSWAANLVGLVVALFAFGVAHGTLNIAMNANAVQVERAWRSSIMSSFHAAYSIGGFLGAAIGGLCAYVGLSPRVTFGAVAVLIAGVAVLASQWVYKGQSTADDVVEPSTAGGLTGVYLLALLAFCCLVGEGAAADWSTVYVRDTLGSSAFFAASAYAAFSIMMMVGRLAGDSQAARFGPVALVRGCGVLAATGLGIALLVNQPVAGVIGFGLFGAGLSCIAPLVFSAAGQRNPDRAGRAIARVASLGWIGFLVGPVAIGSLSEWIGLAAALAVPVVLAAFVALNATALNSRPALDAPVPTV